MINKFVYHFRQGTLSSVLTNKLKSPSRKVKKRFPGLKRDVVNVLKYGVHAPLHMERIWVRPEEITRFLNRDELKRVTGQNRTDSSALIVDWDQFKKFENLQDQYRIQYSFKHWNEGVPWEELGVYDFLKKANKYKHLSQDQIKKRFQDLDQIYMQVKKDGRLKTMEELNANNYKEKGGILIHISNSGEPVFGGVGFHRLAIAKILDLKKIPACIGVVDKRAVKMLKEFRKPPVDHNQAT